MIRRCVNRHRPVRQGNLRTALCSRRRSHSAMPTYSPCGVPAERWSTGIRPKPSSSSSESAPCGRCRPDSIGGRVALQGSSKCLNCGLYRRNANAGYPQPNPSRTWLVMDVRGLIDHAGAPAHHHSTRPESVSAVGRVPLVKTPRASNTATSPCLFSTLVRMCNRPDSLTTFCRNQLPKTASEPETRTGS